MINFVSTGDTIGNVISTHTHSTKPMERDKLFKRGMNPFHPLSCNTQMNFQKDVLIELVNGRRANRKFISKYVWFRMA